MKELLSQIKKLYQEDFVNKLLQWPSEKKEVSNFLEKINFSGKTFFGETNENSLDLILCYEKNQELKEKLRDEGFFIFFDGKNFQVEKVSKLNSDYLNLLEKKLEKENFEISNQKAAKNFGLKKIPKKSEIQNKYQLLLETGKVEKLENLEKNLQRKKIRSLSGVLPLTLMTKPWPCPGDCIFCPDDVKMPKSYLSEETTSQRALRQDFDAYKQTQDRLKAAEKMGHSIEKIELIFLGGTFPSYEKNYQEEFVKDVFKALNGLRKNCKFSLEKLQKLNQTAKSKCVGLSVEIRPDTATDEILIFLRKLGVTRIEMGVQSLNDEVLELNKRGHTVKEVRETTKKLKNYGFKVMYHLMLGLPGSDEKKDYETFKKVFSEKYYQPDQLKIYPCLVLKGTKLEKLQKKLNYKPYTDQQILDLTIKIKKDLIPFYTRIGRITRDVPVQLVANGSKSSNLREKIEAKLKEKKITCNCIRCREVRGESFEEWNFYEEKIQVENGLDYYLEARSSDQKCLGLLRLFLPKKNQIKLEALKNSSLVRELHIYGKLSSIEKKEKHTQHTGLGKKLLEKAEEISKKNGFEKISVISAVGTRNYYEKFGYRLEETYEAKNLK